MYSQCRYLLHGRGGGKDGRKNGSTDGEKDERTEGGRINHSHNLAAITPGEGGEGSMRRRRIEEQD